MKRWQVGAAAALLVGLAVLVVAVKLGDGASDNPSTAAAPIGPMTNVRVACAGDSLTFGEGVATHDNYPSRLQTLLGIGYIVGNFGRPGAAVGAISNLPYTSTEEYKRALDFRPDVVLVMLGTNDALPPNDSPELEAQFIKDYESILRSFVNLPTRPKVYAVTPPGVYGDSLRAKEAILANIIRPGIRQAAADLNVQLVDIANLLGDNPNNFQNDGVHLSPAGFEVMSQALFKVVSTVG